MCGVTGYISKHPTARTAHAFKTLLLANQERGDESTGVYFYNTNTIQKDTKKASDFLSQLDNPQFAKNNIVLGHTRLATMGAVTKDNAHPFKFGDITGIHNGIVSNAYSIYPNAQVDSQAIFYLLDKNKNDYKKSFKQLSGNFGVAWTYSNDDNLYLVSHGNPIHIARSNGDLYFSSDGYPLLITLYAIYKQVDSLKKIDEDVVYIINSKTLDITKKNIEFKQSPFAYLHYANEYAAHSESELIADEWENAWEDDTGDKLGYENELKNIMRGEGCIMCGTPLTHYGYIDDVSLETYCTRCYQKLNIEAQNELLFIEID